MGDSGVWSILVRERESACHRLYAVMRGRELAEGLREGALTESHDVVSVTVAGLADEGKVGGKTAVVGITGLVLVPVGRADVVRELAGAVKHLRASAVGFSFRPPLGVLGSPHDVYAV